MPPKLIHYLRNERRVALPPLETALGYEAVMRKPVSHLFAGMYAGVAERVRAHARDLLARSGVANTALRVRRKRSLERILQ